MFEKLINIYSLMNAWIITTTMGYNIDKLGGINLFNDPNSFERSRLSYFGFSTAMLLTTGHGSSNQTVKPFILVGAPRANVSAMPSVIEPGTVYKCGINDGLCVEWNPDGTGNGRFFVNNGKLTIKQNKDNAWIGATIGVQKITEINQPRVVVCAPRWKNDIIDKHWPNIFMNGMCYWTDVESEETFDKPAKNLLIPLLDDNRQIKTLTKVRIYDYGMGQTGISLHLYSDNDKSDILLGNPGVYNWRGVPLLKKSESNRPIVPSIERQTTILDSSYFGYSVTSGFYMKKDKRLYAAGAPRGHNLFGKVLIFEFPVTDSTMLTIKKMIDGEQHGEYFGASLGSCDVDNDGIDEIVVGAPLWSRYMDEGRVYVYRAQTNDKIVSRNLEGQVIGGRFGSVVTCLGDLDRDGYGDIAVGAPYENDNGGAIYIYNGSPLGLTPRYSQRITGHSISHDIRGFGGSISEPRDIDGNGYVDIAVGAYLSGHVALLHSHPVITIRVTIKLNGTNQPLLQRNKTFFTVKVCSSYDGFMAPPELHVGKTLIVDPIVGRAFFGSGDKSLNGEYKLPNSLLRRRSKICDVLTINVKRDADNYIEPMEIGVSVSVGRPANESINFCSECPVVNEALSKMVDTMKIPYAVDCGADNICTSNLELTVTDDNSLGNNVINYTVGSKATVRLFVRVVNRGEPAYNAQVNVFLPSPILIGGIPPDCTDSHWHGVLKITCQLGNPLRHESTSILELDMSGVRKPGESGNVVIFANVSTRSVNVKTDNEKTMKNLTIKLDVDAEISITGKSQQDVFTYLDRDKVEKFDTITFQHIYQVEKFGQSPIEDSVATISVPTRVATYNDNGTSIEIARVNKTLGIMGRETLNCTISTDIYDKSINLRHNKHRETNFLYFNCTNPDVVQCAKISCKLAIFSKSPTIGKLIVTIDFQLRNLSPEFMSAGDIIYFASNGSVATLQQSSIIGHSDNKNIGYANGTFVSTTFVGSTIESPIAIWIIVLSVIVGIILLVLLTLVLVKLGFFRRTKREQLKALKAEKHINNHGFVLETSSSMQLFDQD